MQLEVERDLAAYVQRSIYTYKLLARSLGMPSTLAFKKLPGWTRPGESRRLGTLTGRWIWNSYQHRGPLDDACPPNSCASILIIQLFLHPVVHNQVAVRIWCCESDLDAMKAEPLQQEMFWWKLTGYFMSYIGLVHFHG